MKAPNRGRGILQGLVKTVNVTCAVFIMYPWSSTLEGIVRYLRNEFLGEAVQRSQIGRAGQVHKNLLYAEGFESGDAATNRRRSAYQRGITESWFEEIWNQSQCCFVTIGDGAERTSGAVDALVVAPH